MDEMLSAAVARIEQEQKRRKRALLIWYVPLWGFVTAGLLIPVGIFGFENTRAVFERFTWFLLLSPSFYIFCAAVISSISVPVAVLRKMPTVVVQDEGNTLLKIFIGIGMILFWTIVFQILIWGSYPFGYDRNGAEHIRMIPFLPWPARSLLHWIWG